MTPPPLQVLEVLEVFSSDEDKIAALRTIEPVRIRERGGGGASCNAPLLAALQPIAPSAFQSVVLLLAEAPPC